jgi:hypothetical protein
MMRLINLDELLKFPIRKNHYDKENGSAEFVNGVESVLEYAEALPQVDAIPIDGDALEMKLQKWLDSEIASPGHDENRTKMILKFMKMIKDMPSLWRVKK